MPQAFLDCVKRGGKVRTQVINKKKGTYMHICYIDGKSYPGEVKTKKKKASIIEMAKELLAELKGLLEYWNDRRKN